MKVGKAIVNIIHSSWVGYWMTDCLVVHANIFFIIGSEKLESIEIVTMRNSEVFSFGS